MNSEDNRLHSTASATMESYNYDPSMEQNYSDDKKAMDEGQQYYQDNNNALSPTMFPMSKSQLAHLRESPAARERRLARNAERMREKRAGESYEEYRKRLEKNALNNRVKRQCESTTEKSIRQVRDAARQRLRRAMETPEQRAERLQKLAERMRVVRRNESPDKKSQRLSRAAQRARERLQNETSEERKVRLQKSSEYARRMRSSNSKSNSVSECDSSMLSDSNFDMKPIVISKVMSNDAELSKRNCVVENNHQVVYEQHQPQVFHHQQQQVITIPSVKTEKIINNIPRINQHQPQYVQNVQFTISPAYTYNNHYHQDNNAPMESSNVNVIIQPAVTTLNIPQYHTMLAVQNPPPKMIPLNKIKVEKQPEVIVSYEDEEVHDQSGQNMVETLVKVEIIEVPRLPKRIRETEEQRIERLRATAERSRIRRQNETPEQRAKRLYDLKTRAKERRDEVKMKESEEERKLRLLKQAEYARSRRMKINSLEGKEIIERKARELYAKIHDNSQTSEKPSVLKILEPIIEMNTST